MMDKNDFSRVAQMSGQELVTWLFLIDKAVKMDAEIAGLQAMWQNWKRPPDAELVAAQAAIKVELARRTQAKGGEQQR